MTGWDQNIRSRVIVVAGLSLATALLLVDKTDFVSPKPLKTDPLLGAVVETLLRKHKVEREQVRTWQVKGPDGRYFRTERRVRTPNGFPSVEFNWELNKAVSPGGARVAGTERTKERVVVLHIVKEGRTVETISLVENPDLSAG